MYFLICLVLPGARLLDTLPAPVFVSKPLHLFEPWSIGQKSKPLNVCSFVG